MRVSLGGSPSSPLRILCLGAHSDDIEIGAGGTILRLLEERPGSHVDWVVFSANATRQAEAQGSANAFLSGAASKNITVKSFRESYFPYVATEIKDAFEQLKQTARPDLVLSHHLRDRHQDHRTVAELTWNTFRDHLILEYEIPKYEGDLGLPSCFVPLRLAHAERKVSLLLEHFSSQHGRPWFRADAFHGLMSVRGIECNAAEGRAEAFHVSKMLI